MRIGLSLLRTLHFSALILCSVTPSRGQGVVYSIKDIGNLGGAGCFPTSISESGHVTGWSFTPNFAEHAFLYNGTITDITPSGVTSSYGASVNSSGTVVGSTVSANQRQAFAFDGSLQHLGLGGGVGSSAHSVNDAGVIVGAIHLANGNSSAFRYDTTMHDLGMLSSGSSSANAISISGVIAGFSNPVGSMSTVHAIRHDGAFHDLGTLGDGAYSTASSINDSGLIAGFSTTFGFDFLNRRAFLYDGAMIDLGTLGGTSSEAYGINASGHVVGYAADSLGASRAFIYRDGVMSDLNSQIDSALGWRLDSAADVNNAGQIVGVGWRDGQVRGFLLTPVPEPNGAMLGMITLTVLVQSRRLLA